MEIHCELDPQDWREFVVLVQKRRRPWWGWIVFPGLFAGIPWAMHQALGMDWVSLLSGATAGVFTVLIYSRLAQRRLQPKSGGNVLGPRTIRIDGQGLFVARQEMETLYRWSSLRSAALTQRLLVLFVDDVAGIIIPRRAVPHEDFQEMLALIRSNAPEAASRLPA